MTKTKKYLFVLCVMLIVLLSVFVITLVNVNKSFAVTGDCLLNWKPLQVQSGKGNINFYPAFNKAEDVCGYEFAVKKGDQYTSIKNTVEYPITMSNIYRSLMDGSISDSHTLYYTKINPNANDLKCYTVKDLLWTEIFIEIDEEHTVYTEDFLNNYCNKGIYTAELGNLAEKQNNFGENWNVNDLTKSPKINGVEYCSMKGDGFYGSYGGFRGGLLTKKSHHPWGSKTYHHYYRKLERAYCLTINDNVLGQHRCSWSSYDLNRSSAVVLTSVFN